MQLLENMMIIFIRWIVSITNNVIYLRESVFVSNKRNNCYRYLLHINNLQHQYFSSKLKLFTKFNKPKSEKMKTTLTNTVVNNKFSKKLVYKIYTGIQNSTKKNDCKKCVQIKTLKSAICTIYSLPTSNTTHFAPKCPCPDVAD